MMKHVKGMDLGAKPVQEQKLRKRLALLQQHADGEQHEQQLQCRGQQMLDKAREILHGLEGFRRWGRFQKGMLDRASATALRQMDVPVSTRFE